MVIVFFGGLLSLFIGSFGGWYWLIPAAVSFLLLVFPVEGFNDPECIETINLLQLKLEKGGHARYYVKVKGRKATFAYDNRRMYKLDGTAYEERMISGNIKIYPSNDCTSPVVKKFITRPERGFFTFAPFSTRIEYVFHIPEGAVYDKKTEAEVLAKNKKNSTIV